MGRGRDEPLCSDHVTRKSWLCFQPGSEVTFYIKAWLGCVLHPYSLPSMSALESLCIFPPSTQMLVLSRRWNTQLRETSPWWRPCVTALCKQSWAGFYFLYVFLVKCILSLLMSLRWYTLLQKTKISSKVPKIHVVIFLSLKWKGKYPPPRASMRNRWDNSSI